MSHDQDVQAIESMYQEALTAFRAGDLETVLDHWVDDGVYLWPAVPPALGKAAIRSAYEGFFAEWTAEETFYRHGTEVSGDLAYSRFSTDLVLTPKPGGEPNRMNLHGIHVYRRTPDGWRFKVVIAIDVPAGTPHE